MTFSLINIFIPVLWFFATLLDYFEYGYIWQLKEYRTDRFRDFLSTKQGHYYWLRYSILGRALLCLTLFFWPINDVLFIKEVIIIVFLVDIGRKFVDYMQGRLERPQITKKIICVILLGMLLEAGALYWHEDWMLFFLVIVFRFLTITFSVYCINFISKQLKKIIISRATKKIEQNKHLLVIGITGSYAKSTVKHFLGEILAKKFSLVYPPGNINTDIGIAQFILKNDFSKKQILIVEMGAYTTGEIDAICQMVKPKIGILTAINEQHLSLFGDIKKTQEAKYELLRALPTDGLAITNSDNELCREFLGTLKSKVLTFGYDEEYKPNCKIIDAKTEKNVLHCSFGVEEDVWKTSCKIPGDHNCINLAPCLLVARHLGFSKNEIISFFPELTNVANKLQIYEFGASIIIDDSYNSNPNGFKAALMFLNTFSSDKRRIVITRGMAELGSRAPALHEEIGEEISLVADELVIISRDNETSLRKGILEKFKTNVITINNPVRLYEYVEELKKKKCVILIENRLPKMVADLIAKK